MSNTNKPIKIIEPPAGTCPPQVAVIYLPDDISDEHRAELHKCLDRLQAECRLRINWSPLFARSRGKKQSGKRRLASKPNCGPTVDDYENCVGVRAQTDTEIPNLGCVHDPVDGCSGNG